MVMITLGSQHIKDNLNTAQGKEPVGILQHHFRDCVVRDDEEAEKRAHECLQMQKPECYHHEIFKTA
jgi:hypothetical protein